MTVRTAASRTPAAVVSTLLLTAVCAVGVAAYVYPFLLADAPENSVNPRSGDAPLLFALVLSLALLLFVAELTRTGMNAKVVSLLAVVTVAAAALRVPTLPAGATGFFFMVIVAGYVFGPRLGFLVGAGALFVSSFVVGGFGPWLPFQLFATGWVGMTSGWLGLALQRPMRRHRRLELLLLAAFAGAWGMLFGAITNLWFWPYAAQGDSISWQAGMGLGDALSHYWSFYLLTSAGWDVWRAIGNVALVLVAGRPVLDLLTRYRDRFQVRFD
ncbi:MAG: ECF transporter S component [Chloroflexi bacterium]|nr:ECF transporter S component [Chloroflexota bacterium]